MLISRVSLLDVKNICESPIKEPPYASNIKGGARNSNSLSLSLPNSSGIFIFYFLFGQRQCMFSLQLVNREFRLGISEKKVEKTKPYEQWACLLHCPNFLTIIAVASPV